MSLSSAASHEPADTPSSMSSQANHLILPKPGITKLPDTLSNEQTTSCVCRHAPPAPQQHRRGFATVGTGHDSGPHRRLHKAWLAPNAKPSGHAVFGAYCGWLPRSFPTQASGTPQNPLGSSVGSPWTSQAAPRPSRLHVTSVTCFSRARRKSRMGYACSLFMRPAFWSFASKWLLGPCSKAMCMYMSIIQFHVEGRMHEGFQFCLCLKNPCCMA